MLINGHGVGKEHFTFKSNRSSLHNFLVSGSFIGGEMENDGDLVVENDFVV